MALENVRAIKLKFVLVFFDTKVCRGECLKSFAVCVRNIFTSLNSFSKRLRIFCRLIFVYSKHNFYGSAGILFL